MFCTQTLSKTLPTPGTIDCAKDGVGATQQEQFHRCLTTLPTLDVSTKVIKFTPFFALANSKPNIVVDYHTDRVTLVRNVLDQFFDHLALDQLLLFGAGLVEALDIHPTDTDEQHTRLYRKLTRAKRVVVDYLSGQGPCLNTESKIC